MGLFIEPVPLPAENDFTLVLAGSRAQYPITLKNKLDPRQTILRVAPPCARRKDSVFTSF